MEQPLLQPRIHALPEQNGAIAAHGFHHEAPIERPWARGLLRGHQPGPGPAVARQHDRVAGMGGIDQTGQLPPGFAQADCNPIHRHER